MEAGLGLVVYLVNIHLITRLQRPELRPVAVCTVIYAGRAHLEEAKLVR
jgi:hypothetical protein